MAKLFISYNHNDKTLVDTVARRLELEFGRNNIFYDAWSIQPGDSIVGKMNEGLEGFDTFFLLLSPSSLSSKMVSLEWRSALNRAVNNNLKFVVVRIADCNLPAILADMLYIDLYGEGLDSSIEKMKRVVKLENCYTPLEDIQNYKVEASIVDSQTIRFTIRAIYFAEHNPEFAFACENTLEEFSMVGTISDGTIMSGGRTLTFQNGRDLHARTLQLQRALKPGFPFITELKTGDISKLRTISVFVLTNAEERIYQQLSIEKV